MSHFAEISGSNNVVTRVIVAEQDFIDSGALGSPANWIQTSYNTRGGVHYGQDGEPDDGEQLRKNYAGAGYTYDESRDAFMIDQPFPSWTLNEDTCLWDSPVAHPDDGERYQWNEDNGAWELGGD
jgi:hypothetical protein